MEYSGGFWLWACFDVYRCCYLSVIGFSLLHNSTTTRWQMPRDLGSVRDCLQLWSWNREQFSRDCPSKTKGCVCLRAFQFLIFIADDVAIGQQAFEWLRRICVLQPLFLIISISFAGFIFLHQPGVKQQATFWVLFTDHPIRSLPSEGNGWNRASHGMELHINHIRRKQLRHQGELSVSFSLFGLHYVPCIIG